MSKKIDAKYVSEKAIRWEKNPIKAMRRFCLDCVGNSYKEVELCMGYTAQLPCPLYPFRFGNNPFSSRKGTLNKALTAHNEARKREKISEIDELEGHTNQS